MRVKTRSPPGSDRQLRANAVGFFSTLAESVSDIGPSPSVALVVPLVFTVAGAGSWLSWTIVAAALLCVAYCCAEVARRYATTGGLIGLVAGTGYRLPALAVTGCVVTFILVVSPANVLGTGLLFQHWLGALGVRPGNGLLLLLGLAALVIGFYIAYRGIRVSAVVFLAVEAVTIGLIVVLMIVVMIRHRGGIIDHAQLSLRGASPHAILLGSAAAAYALTSFECSATLGEETRHARRNIPRSLYASVIFSCALFVTASYVMALGFEGTKLSLLTSPDPLSDLARLYGVSVLRYFLLLGVALGYLAAVVAFTNWSVRVLFTLAREGLIPRYFATTDPKTGTPKRSLVLLAGFTAVSMLILAAAGQSTVTVWRYLATCAVLMYVTGYVIAMLTFSLYGARRVHSGAMAAVGLTGGAAFGYVLYTSVVPVPHYPLSVWTWLAVGVSAASCAGAAALWLCRARVARTFGRTVAVDTVLADVADSRLRH